MRTALALVVVLAACRRETQPQPQTQTQQATPPPGASVTPPPRALVNPPRPPELAHVTIKALGMYCEESCPMKVRYALADIPQIYELGFDLTKESIFVSYDAKLGSVKQVTKPMLVAI